MKNKNLYFVIIALFLSQTVFTQNKLSGFVTDQETQELLLFCSIILYQNDEFLLGTQSDYDGYFEIKEIPDGSFEMEISYIGYQPLRKTLVFPQKADASPQEIFEMKPGVTLDVVDIRAYKTSNRFGCGGWGCGNTITKEEKCNALTEPIEKPEFRKQAKNRLLENTARIYPNPAIDYIHANVSEKVKYLSIADITGNQLAFVRNTSTSRITLPVNNFLSGTYLLTFIYEDGKLETERFVKVE